MSEEKSVRAPFPGTFYRRPDPDSPPFVEEGAEVKPDTVIGLIEVMKMFQEITADTAGVVVSFGVADGATIDAGDTIAVLS